MSEHHTDPKWSGMFGESEERLRGLTNRNSHVFEYSQQFKDLIRSFDPSKNRWPNYARYIEDALGGPTSRLVKCATELVPEIEFHCGELADKTAVDYGCGTGATTVPLAQRCKRVIAFDVDEALVDVCRYRLREHGLEDRVECVAGRDASALRNQRAQADFVLMNGVIEHVPLSEPRLRQTVVQGAAGLLKRGGYLVVNDTPNRISPVDLHTTQLWWIPWTRPGSHWAYRQAGRKGRYFDSSNSSAGPRGLEEAGGWGATYWELSGYLRDLGFVCLNLERGHNRRLRYRPARKNRKRDAFELLMFALAVKLLHVPITAFTPDLTNLIFKKM